MSARNASTSSRRASAPPVFGGTFFLPIFPSMRADSEYTDAGGKENVPGWETESAGTTKNGTRNLQNPIDSGGCFMLRIILVLAASVSIASAYCEYGRKFDEDYVGGGKLVSYDFGRGRILKFKFPTGAEIPYTIRFDFYTHEVCWD